MMEAMMVEQDWQARAQQRKRKLYGLIGLLFGMGLVSGFMIGFFEDDNSGFVAAASIPPWVAVVAATLFGLAVTYGAIRFHRSSDELERRNMTYGAAMGGNAVMIAFPLWFILWKGGLVPAPDALALFAIGYIANVAGYFWYKFR